MHGNLLFAYTEDIPITNIYKIKYISFYPYIKDN